MAGCGVADSRAVRQPWRSKIRRKDTVADHRAEAKDRFALVGNDARVHGRYCRVYRPMYRVR
jgi:hypothetical protein